MPMEIKAEKWPDGRLITVDGQSVAFVRGDPEIVAPNMVTANPLAEVDALLNAANAELGDLLECLEGFDDYHARAKRASDLLDQAAERLRRQA